MGSYDKLSISCRELIKSNSVMLWGICWAAKYSTVSSRWALCWGGASGRDQSEQVLGFLACGRVMNMYWGSLACGRVMLEGERRGSRGIL